MQALLNIALPVFGIILAGYLVGRFRLLGEGSSVALNGFVYWVALPALLVSAMARVPLGQAFDVKFLAAFIGGIAATFLLTMAIGARAFANPPAARALQGLGAAFANTGYLGVPLFLTAFGSERALPAIISTAINAALTMGAGIVLVEAALSHGTKWRAVAADVGRALATNPLVLAPLAGLVLSGAGVRLPVPLETFCNLLGSAAAPCALFALGLFLVGKPLAQNIPEVAWITVMKLLAQPALTWLIGGPILGMEPFWLGATVLLAALPTAALVFTLAQQYGVYVERASSAILVTTALSVVTIPLILILFDLR
jgi:malonate transporter